MGRWSKERHAQEAAKKAAKAAQEAEANPQEQVEQVEPEEPKDKPLPSQSRGNERDDAMEEIVAHRNREAGVEEPKPEEPAAEAEAKTDPQPQAPEAVESAVETPAPEAPKLVKVKVDGDEFEVSQADIDEAGGVRAYQTQKAAENRLKKSNEALAEAKKLQAFLIEMATKQANPQPKEPSEDEFIQSKLDAIRYGTAEEGASAMREVLNRQRIDPRQITDQATQAAVVHMARTQASQQFKQEFSDVASNPLLMKLASSLENERLGQLRSEQANPVMVDWGDFYRNIGNQIRSVVRPSQPTTPQATNGNPSPASEKEARKASIVNLPTAAAKAELPKEEKPQTREDILNEMRSGRPA